MKPRGGRAPAAPRPAGRARASSATSPMSPRSRFGVPHRGERVPERPSPSASSTCASLSPIRSSPPPSRSLTAYCDLEWAERREQRADALALREAAARRRELVERVRELGQRQRTGRRGHLGVQQHRARGIAQVAQRQRALAQRVARQPGRTATAPRTRSRRRRCRAHVVAREHEPREVARGDRAATRRRASGDRPSSTAPFSSRFVVRADRVGGGAPAREAVGRGLRRRAVVDHAGPGGTRRTAAAAAAGQACRRYAGPGVGAGAVASGAVASGAVASGAVVSGASGSADRTAVRAPAARYQ